jgi:hypothetical protein
MKRITICLLLSLLAITAHSEVVGEFKGIIVAAATPAELAETVFPPFYLIANADAPNDLRMSDGVTPGGLRVCPEGVLTNIPASFPHPVAFNGNPIALNGAYTIGAEGSHCYIRSNGSNVLSILAQPAGVGQTLSTEYAGNDTLRVMLAVEDAAVDPLVEYTTNAISPIWTNCSYTVARPSTNTVQLDIDIPEADRSGYYRITALTAFRVRFGMPLEAPSISTDAFTLSNATFRVSGTNLLLIINNVTNLVNLTPQ